jgi:hypothetical protein
MTWAGKTAVGSNYEEFHDFNEVLTLAYFEDMKIDVSLSLRINRFQLTLNSTMMMVKRLWDPLFALYLLDAMH